MTKQDDKITIESVTSTSFRQHVDRAKYAAMREALLAVLPSEPPGIAVPEAKAALLPLLPNDLFPGGEKAGWWLKAVQLDLEAKKVIKRGLDQLVRLFSVSS
jgi:hypothetical protein